MSNPASGTPSYRSPPPIPAATRRALAGWAVAGAMLLVASAAAAQPLREITIGLSSSSFATAPARIANELNFFAEHGLKPRFISLESGSAAVTGLISRSIDFALAGSGEFVAAHAHGQKVVGLLTIYTGSGGTVVLSKAVADKLGVSPTAPVPERLKALDKLVFASPSAPSAYTVTLRSAVASRGSNARFTFMAQPAMPAALESGAIQGYIASAPFWALPVTRGTGVVWLSAPRGELPAEFSPASAIMLMALRTQAEANRDLVAQVEAVFADFIKAVKERPADVKAAIGKLYPDLDPATLNLLFESESLGWAAQPVSAADAAHEIAFVKMSGVPLPTIDAVDPATMVFH